MLALVGVLFALPRTVATSAGGLSDLAPASNGPLDGASAEVRIARQGFSSRVSVRVSGIDPAAAGRTIGTHLHVGPCVAGDPKAAGAHYNADTEAGRTPPRVTVETEVWLDFVVHTDGTGSALAKVPFRIPPGQRAIVFHAEPTDQHGAAGERHACLPVVWS